VTERDYRRLLNLALDLGDEAAANEAISMAARRGDHETGRLLIGRFDRERLSGWMASIPRTHGTRMYRGIALEWDPSTSRLFAVCVVERVLPRLELAFPDDRRPRQAVDMARKFALGAATLDDLTGAWRAAVHAGRGGEWAMRLYARAAEWAAAPVEWAEQYAEEVAVYVASGIGGEHGEDAREREEAWQHELLLRFLLGEVDGENCT